MKGEHVVGIGCFARPATLKRVFQKMISNWAPATIESLGAATAEKIFGQGDVRQPDLSVSGAAAEGPAQLVYNLESRQITGFFLSQKGQRLKLTVFARGQRAQRQRYLLTLEDA